MKKLTIIFGLTILITACNLFQDKEKKAIEICQKTKLQYDYSLLLGINGLDNNSTILDYANFQAKKEPNKRYDWEAKPTYVPNIYIVGFTDQDNWGQRWEVDIEQQIVKDINANEYLSRKYGLSSLDQSGNFEITNIIIDTLKLEKSNSYYSENSSPEIVYVLKASVKNKTNKTLSDAEISGKLQVIFKDKTIDGYSNEESGFKTKISTSKPWIPDTKINFYIKTKGIEKIYLNYEPEYVFFAVRLKAEDPVGFAYDKYIEEYDIKNKWKSFK